LTQGVLRIAQFCAMYHKNKHQRPRPSQLSPSLNPPVEVPGHASFPSAHATESYTLSLTLAEIFHRANQLNPALQVIPSVPDPPPVPPAPPPLVLLADPLTRLAQRVSRNREVLGLHYPSDSAAGKDLAQQIFQILVGLDNAGNPVCPTINALIDAAAAEWRRYTSGGPLP